MLQSMRIKKGLQLLIQLELNFKRSKEKTGLQVQQQTQA